MLRNNSCYFYNYKLYCVIHRNSCCICCRLDWLLPHLNPKIFLFIFNIGGRHNWISCCQSNSIQENFLFKKRKSQTGCNFCGNMYSILYYCRQLTDNYVYGRSSSLPLLILTKWYYEWKLKSRNFNHYNYFICTSCHTFCYNSILPYGKKWGLQKQSKHRQKESHNNLPDIFCFAYDSNTAF